MKSFDEKKTAALLFCGMCGIGIIYLTVKYLLGLLMPFVLAILLTSCLRRPSLRLSKRLKISHGAASFILLTLCILLAVTLLFFTVNRLASEGERLIWGLSVNAEKLGRSISGLFESMSDTNVEKIPVIKSLMQSEIFRELFENADTFVTDAVSDAAMLIVRKAPSAVLSVMSRLPRMLAFTAVTVIASFYFGFCYDKIILKLPEKRKKMIEKIKKCLFGTVISYIKASSLLFLITFAILFGGFSFLGVTSPFLTSALVAVVDILPILGVGTVLIPWGLLKLILYRDVFSGVGLLVLYVVAVIIRRLSEPKIMAKELGLHPLVALFATYTGMRIFGVLGMILFPLIAGVLKTLWRELRNVDKRETL